MRPDIVLLPIAVQMEASPSIIFITMCLEDVLCRGRRVDQSLVRLTIAIEVFVASQKQAIIDENRRGIEGLIFRQSVGGD